MLEAFEIIVEITLVMGSLRFPLLSVVRKINHLLLTHISESRTTAALARTQISFTPGSGSSTKKVYK